MKTPPKPQTSLERLTADPAFQSRIRAARPTCPSTILAERCGIRHAVILKLIGRHLNCIEAGFGPVRFEATGGKRRVALLTEEQAFFVVMLLPPSPAPTLFKAAAVEVFFAMRDQRGNIPGILAQHQQMLLTATP